MKLALCKGTPTGEDDEKKKKKDLFFPDRGETAEMAMKICLDCTVKTECNSYADKIGATVGVWGGKRRV